MTRPLTDDIKKWLATGDSEEHTLQGAQLLLRINRNRILYDNARRSPSRYAPYVRRELQKILDARNKDDAIQATRRQMQEMVETVEKKIMPQRTAEIRNGKRADHDELPPEIQKLYSDNDQIRLKIRECHLRMRMVSPENSSCPDSDRYPWAKEIIRLDKIYRENWFRYDHYDRNTGAVVAPDDPQAKSTNALKLLNMNKAHYAKHRSPQLKKQMQQWFSMVIQPSDKLIFELRALGILDE